MAFDVPGGGEMQLLAYHRYLDAHGVEAVLFNQWKPELDEFSVVHFFSTVSGSEHFCRYVTRRGLPLVISSSLWVTEETRDQYPMADIQYLLSLADVIVTNSDMESRQLATMFGLPEARFLTVYNGIDPDFARPFSPGLFRGQYPELERFVLNVGNIEPRKNQLGLIRAMQMAYPDYPLVLIGQVRDRDYSRQCFEEGGQTLRYLGPLPHDAELMRSAMAACDLFVIPSTLETPSLAALEAAAQGARIAITEVGSTREYFRDLVHYLDPGDQNSIIAAIGAGLTAPHDTALGNLIRHSYTWKNVIAPLATCYRELAGRTA